MTGQVHRSKSAQRREEVQVEPVDVKSDEEVERLKAETEALLDDIDELLEGVTGNLTAQQFVDEYRQRGGE